VVEEVVVGKEATERTETINDTVRGTQVEVERVEGKKGKSRESTTPAKPV
jgi:stress response protein YsnF